MSDSDSKPDKRERRRRRTGEEETLASLAKRAPEQWRAPVDEPLGVPHDPEWDTDDEQYDSEPEHTIVHEEERVSLPQDLPAEPKDPDPSTQIYLSLVDIEPTHERQLFRSLGVCREPLSDSGARPIPVAPNQQPFAVGDMVQYEAHGETHVGFVTLGEKARPARPVGRILRQASDAEKRTHQQEVGDCSDILAAAKHAIQQSGAELRVFRAEPLGKQGVALYVTAADKLSLEQLRVLTALDVERKVEVRQVGVRDEAKQVGGIGSCGETLCCSTWLPQFAPVSIRNAKMQGLVLNPSKISGQCGRLKCCLVYEHEQYATLRKQLPKVGRQVLLPDGREGRVIELNVLAEQAKVAIAGGPTRVYRAHEMKKLSQPPRETGSEPKKKRD